MTDTTRSDVESVYGAKGMDDSDAEALVTIANNLADDVFGGTTRTLGEIEGNEKDFKTYLAAALWTVREGELESESQAGGSFSVNVQTPGEMEVWLQNLNKYGEVAAGYIRTGTNVSVEWA